MLAGLHISNVKGRIVSTALHKESTQHKSAQGNGSGTMQLVSFRLAQEEYGIEITKVQEIILVGEITRMPKTPYYIRGLINLRSMVIPIVDLRLRFGMEPQETTDETRIMVVNVAGKTIGIVVDAVSEVLRIHHDQIAPTPPTIAGLGHDYLSGLVRGENRLLILLDIDNILGQAEGEAVDALVQMDPPATSLTRSAV
ncbi:MAG: purine-binding chemotaxis protein CheW [Pirellulales bacterium]|nr:purine-binding chemotaxis protein CheW [Pirellulales bacterium]